MNIWKPFSNKLIFIIPLILILLFITIPLQLLQLTYNPLGKFLFICIVMFYTKQHLLLGIFGALLYILYIQSDYYTNGYHYFVNTTTEKMTEYSYPVVEPQNNNANLFAQRHCKNGILHKNNIPVDTEMTEHVFPQVHFKQKQPCNICNDDCPFSILDSRIDLEHKMILPKDSNQWYDNFIKPQLSEIENNSNYTPRPCPCNCTESGGGSMQTIMFTF